MSPTLRRQNVIGAEMSEEEYQLYELYASDIPVMGQQGDIIGLPEGFLGYELELNGVLYFFYVNEAAEALHAELLEKEADEATTEAYSDSESCEGDRTISYEFLDLRDDFDFYF
jgi:hypothetical protein